MRTSLTISLILLAVVLAGGILNMQVTHRISDQYISAAEELRILTQDGHWERAAQVVSTYRDEWEQALKWLQILINHADADDVTLALTRLDAGIRVQDISVCMQACGELREYAQHIYHRDAFTIGNVL